MFEQEKKGLDKMLATLPVPAAAHLERRRSSDYDPWYQEPMKLFHGLQIDDTVGFTHPNDNDLTTSIATGSPSAISGTWGGYLCLTTDPSTTYFHLPVINLLVDNNGVVFGVGSSWWGDQVIRGSVEGNHVEMDRMVIPHPRMQESQVLRTQRYIGTLNDRLDEMKGTYGPANEDGSCISEGNETFNFRLLRRSPAYFQTYPQYDELLANRWRSLWQLAIKATRQSVMSWRSIRDCRDRRRRFIFLVTKEEDNKEFTSEENEEYSRFCSYKTALASEVRNWRALAYFLLRRRIRHPYVNILLF